MLSRSVLTARACALPRTHTAAATAPSAMWMSTWSNVEEGPPDPILGVSLAFAASESPLKINLGVGAYRDDNNKPFVLSSVAKAEASFVGKENHEYAGILGIPDMPQLAAQYALGWDMDRIKTSTVATQTISGTGAVRVGCEFLSRFYTKSKSVYLPSPTWGNHIPIVADSGLNVETYTYYKPETRGLDFEGMITDLKNIPNGSAVLLHACAHNPTGVDPSHEQWREIHEVFKAKDHFAFFDMAYQGFASGDANKDAFAVRLFADSGSPMLLCQSFAKNMGLYGERAGALTLFTEGNEERLAVDSQMKIIVRPMYSNPPIHGARIVKTILTDPALKAEWEGEVKGMADRIIRMRNLLRGKLEELGSPHNWEHITNQIGMFAFTGMTPEQVDNIKTKHEVYLTRNGRISIAGITPDNVDHLAQAMHDVTK